MRQYPFPSLAMSSGFNTVQPQPMSTRPPRIERRNSEELEGCCLAKIVISNLLTLTRSVARVLSLSAWFLTLLTCVGSELNNLVIEFPYTVSVLPYDRLRVISHSSFVSLSLFSFSLAVQQVKGIIRGAVCDGICESTVNN